MNDTSRNNEAELEQEQEPQDTQELQASQASQKTPKGPRPEPIRLFGTTWLNHDGNYTARRVTVTAGSLAALAVSCLVLRLAYEGLQLAAVGGFVSILVVVMFATCSALAFGHTWGAFTKRPDPARQSSLRGLLTIGFLGSLTAYFLRSLKEAPGESRNREEYTTARRQYDRRTAKRTKNPAKRRRP
ncbi:EamA/RhaT family transporter [Streptomyces europaeiscabiei]|uniref:EamA/RhaT family transporter n=1 Tax=Streptomyces europaeiscabiei TaxID=146819 RepID=UPI0029AC8569|nr:EamA/RhaT family transporter [Streptomyces europaeiscabiei]MDX2766114.1 EamA/RhaT family transporter [Streptomyces europaeiscabiei]